MHQVPMKRVTCIVYSTWCIMICLVIPILSLLLFIQSLYSLSKLQVFYLPVENAFPISQQCYLAPLYALLRKGSCWNLEKQGKATNPPAFSFITALGRQFCFPASLLSCILHCCPRICIMNSQSPLHHRPYHQ